MSTAKFYAANMTNDRYNEYLTRIDSNWSTEELEQRTLEQVFRETILEM
jgi:hypothetical protein